MGHLIQHTAAAAEGVKMTNKTSNKFSMKSEQRH